MKNSNGLLFVVAMMSMGLSGPAHADGQPGGTLVEIPVEAMLAPATGFDDNDNVQVVLHGSLPNTCYTLGEHRVERAGDSNTIRVRQFAVQKGDGICAQGAVMPAHLMMLVPFTTEVSLGQLGAGNYRIAYDRTDGSTGYRTLNVAVASVTTVDSLPYALVTGALTSDVVSTGQKIEITLSGMLNSSCTELDPDIRVQRQNDVFVVMPLIRVKPGVICTQMLRPFQAEITLDAVPAGHYLVHVRSMSGRAVNRIVEVVR